MCCQPPKRKDDIDRLFKENLQLVRTAPKELKILGISGGEPSLLGDKLFELLDEIRNSLPDTGIHLLSNGRAFANRDFTHRLKQVAGDKVCVGVPFHSDYPGDHDLIAGAKGAYEETILGLYTLASEGIEIELRVVINRLNYVRLPQMSEFINKNLPFVNWVAFMGMEKTGLAVRNLNKIWIEPIEYIPKLTEAVQRLYDWDIDVAIYNIPLCLLPNKYHQFAEQSISDWKVRYQPFCEGCALKEKCCGLFATSCEPYLGLNPFINGSKQE
jgi:His-Xaa-Ser system radical SAM maturase HxsC